MKEIMSNLEDNLEKYSDEDVKEALEILEGDMDSEEAEQVLGEMRMDQIMSNLEKNLEKYSNEDIA
jgi:hypothetical protein